MAEINHEINREIKLDTKDKKILYELDMDARQPITKIAKKVKLSREVVTYRIKQLEESGVIEGYYTVINIAKLGYMYVRVFIRFENISPTTEKELIEYAKKHKSIGWVASDGGEDDFGIVYWVKSISELEELLLELDSKFGQFFHSKYVSIATRILHFKHNYLFPTKDYGEAILDCELEQPKNVAMDLLILGELVNNSRISVSDIAKKIKMTPNAVKQRIKNLIAAGIIQSFRIKINTQLLGFQHFKVFLVLQNMDKERYKKLISFLRYSDNVIYVTYAIGTYPLEFEIMCRSNNEFNEYIKKLRIEFSGFVKEYRFIEVYKEYLINYLPRYKVVSGV